MRPSHTHLTGLLALLFAVPLLAQEPAMRKGRLLTSLGGGAGLLQLESNVPGVGGEMEAGAVRFAFAHAFSDRFSLGLHYDRIGSDQHGAPLERLRVTTYLLEGVWRPWVGRRGAWEMHVGLGSGLLALRPNDERLPITAVHGALAVGTRYLHMLSGTLGAFLAADHAMGGTAELYFDGELLTDAEGEPFTASWRSQRLTGGLLLRF